MGEGDEVGEEGRAGNGKSRDLPRSLAGLIQTYLDKMAASSEFKAFVGYAAHGVWSNLTKSRSRYLTDHGQTLLRFLPVGAVKLREGIEEQNVDGSMSMDWFSSSEGVPLEDATTQTF